MRRYLHLRTKIGGEGCGSRSRGGGRPYRAALGLATAALVCALGLMPQSAAASKDVVRTTGSEASEIGGGLFSTPRGVAVNQTGNGKVPAGTFYVVDSGNRRIQRFGPTGDFVSAWGWGVATGKEAFEICEVAASCRAGLPGAGAGAFGSNGAQGIAVDQANGNVYVSDQAFQNRRIDVFSASGAFQGAFGWGARSSANEFQFCTALTGCSSANVSAGGQGGKLGTAIGGLAVDAAGKLYVADKTNRRISVFKPILTGTAVTGIEFLRAFGRDVVTTGKPNDAGTTAFEVCDTAAGNVPADCKAGTAGTEAGSFGGTNASPADVAVDSEGNVFALDFSNKRVQEFSPASMPVEENFGSAELEAVFGAGATLQSIAVDPSTAPNHLLVSGSRVGSENEIAVAELDHSGANALGVGLAHGEGLESTQSNGLGVAPASLGGNVYVSSSNGENRLFVLNEPPLIQPVGAITGTTAVLKGTVVSNEIDVTFHFEYSIDGVNWIKAPAADADAGSQPGTIEVEDEVGGLTGSQLYRVRLVQDRPAGGGSITSGETTFETGPSAPTVSGTVASQLSDRAATLNGQLNPENQPTTYWFEYGLADCLTNPCTSVAASESSGGGLRPVAQGLTGLEPETVYHFRLVAANGTGTTAGPDRTFATLASGSALPDRRAYELVSPADTGSIVPSAKGLGEAEGRDCFATSLATAGGDSVIFLGKGGTLPGVKGNGFLDEFEAVRTAEGWTTDLVSPSGEETSRPPGGGCVSADHRYSTLLTGESPFDTGSLAVGGEETSYVHRLGASFEVAGQGSVVNDQDADVRWITAGENKIVFTSGLQLEPNAPESAGPGFGQEGDAAAVGAIYERSPGEATRTVSLLPGGLSPDPSTETTFYEGVSKDGSAVAFKVEEGLTGATTLYERRDGTTLPVITSPSFGGATFAGLSASGDKAFYVEPDNPGESFSSQVGQLFAFSVDGEATTPITPGGGASFVNVSADGSHVYFTSPEQLDGGNGIAGANNLYVWDGGAPRFIAVLDPADVVTGTGEPSLASWARSVASPEQTTLSGPASDPSRATPDGDVLVFESRASLAGNDSGGYREIYRYSADDEGLTCVSCSPSGELTSADSELQVFAPAFASVSAIVDIANVTDDGQEVFFQTKGSLVPEDVNQAYDVYEWKEGRLSLVSAGDGSPSFLYGMTPDGHDIFFTTSDRLVPQDRSAIISIYDARVDGVSAVSTTPRPPCQDDSCQGTPGSTPQLPAASSAAFQGAGNARPHRPHVRPHKKRHQKHHHRRSRHNRGGAK